jgi:hypothetical protein
MYFNQTWCAHQELEAVYCTPLSDIDKDAEENSYMEEIVACWHIIRWWFFVRDSRKIWNFC